MQVSVSATYSRLLSLSDADLLNAISTSPQHEMPGVLQGVYSLSLFLTSFYRKHESECLFAHKILSLMFAWMLFCNCIIVYPPNLHKDRHIYDYLFVSLTPGSGNRVFFFGYEAS